MLDPDQTQRFIIQNTAIRGQFVSLNQAFSDIITRVQSTGRATQLLGEALASVVLLAATLKIQGKLTLQVRGDGDLTLLVAQATSKQSVRGLIRGEISELDQRPLNQLFHSEQLVLTIDTAGSDQPHQGIVPLLGNNIAQALRGYFEHSEQLPTQLWLSVNNGNASGLLLQQMPNSDHVDKSHQQQQDDWQRVQMLAETLSDAELGQLSSLEILHRLYHEDDIILFDAQPIEFDCSCSRQRSEQLIKSLGLAEAEQILAEQHRIEITCEFCNQRYEFDAIDVAALFSSIEQGSNPKVNH